MQDQIRVTVHYFRVYEKLTSSALKEYYLSPIELLIDVPFDVGCFKEIESIAGGLTGVSGTPPNGINPAWCLTNCVQATKRFACE